MKTEYRDAAEDDLPAIVALLADDHLGAEREALSDPLPASYGAAFKAMKKNPYQRLVVAVQGQSVVGTLQLLLIPALSSQGSWHGQIEAVRIAAELRGRGQGEEFIRWAIEQCRSAGCGSIQLVSDNSRAAAHRFWRRLGFISSHVGFKLKL